MTFMAMNQSVTGFWVHTCTVLSGVLLGVLLLLLVCTLAVHFVHLFVHFYPKVFGIMVLLSTLGLSIFGLWNASHPRLKEVEVSLPGLTTTVDIVQLSDLHLGHFRGRGHLQQVVDLANSASPDFVVITGDLFESQYNLQAETVEPLKQLRAPVYFVEGNHDLYVGSDRVKEVLREVGIHVLENEVVTTHGLQLVGLNYMMASWSEADPMHATTRSETMASVLPRLPLDAQQPAVLLHHHPVGVPLAQKAGIDLYLAGHTHGGQLFPITVLNHFLFPYNRGLYAVKETDAYSSKKTEVYVSCGSGTFGTPMRIGTTSEVTHVHLTPASSSRP